MNRDHCSKAINENEQEIHRSMTLSHETNETPGVSSQHDFSAMTTQTTSPNTHTKTQITEYYTIQNVPNKGRGVFATQDLPFGFHLHTAPCILVTQQEYESHMKYTVLEHYLFNCSDGDRLMALGHGSLFNHDSKRPNVDYKLDKENLEIHYSVGHYGAKKGEELCIFYGGKLWFDDADKNEDSDSSSDDEDNALGSFLGKMEL